jgi:hypothetical protein
VPPAEVDRLPLHPGFGAAWPFLQTLGPAPLLVVDAANTIGAQPDGWWRDRSGAVRRLRDRLVRALGQGLDLNGVTDLGLDGEVRWLPEVILVTEGVTRDVEPAEGVRVEAAPGSGDDTIVELVAAELSGTDDPCSRPVVVVTSDRELRGRVEAYGAPTWSPRALLDQL